MAAVQVKNDMKMKFVLDKLIEKGVTLSQQGISIHELNYDELKYELVLLAFREIDVEHHENKWF